MYLYAKDLSNEGEQITYLELLRKLYSPKKFESAADGLEELWAVYLTRDIAKAILLANELGETNSDWKELKAFTLNIAEERRLAQNGDYNKANILIKQMKQPKYLGIDDFFYLEKATVLNKAGNTQAAYETLTAAYAENPTDKLFTAMKVYGKLLGKAETVITRDVETIRDKFAFAAPPFDLGLYTSDARLRLEDLKGDVVLLTFWFPGCGPCRSEFPHFQAVINEYKGRPVKFVGINVAPGQDQYVIPFLQNNNYSMIPLRGNPAITTAYHVRGEPANFLIDQEGKVVFEKFRIGNTNHRTLELMINSLLNPTQ